METAIWICTGIICIVIIFLVYMVSDIENSLSRIESLLEEIRNKL